jgi:hypothetical protein
MAKLIKRSKNSKASRVVPLDDFVAFTVVDDNGDGTYTLAGIMSPSLPVQVQAFDCDGNAASDVYTCTPSGGATSWGVDPLTIYVGAVEPYTIVAQSGDASATVITIILPVLGLDGIKKPKKKTAKKKLAKKA